MKEFLKTFPIACLVGASVSTAQPPVVDDAAIAHALREQLASVVESEKGLSGEAIAKAASEAPRAYALQLPERSATHEASDYETLARSVFVLGSIYNCGKCEQWHNGGGATAWALTEDGVMVTNHHVFANATGDCWGVCSFDGDVFPITEVLASEPDEDLAIFRVDTGGAKVRPLPLAESAPVGSRVTMISHPEGRYFFQSSGEIARYLRTPERRNTKARTWMSITADYAKGSSGGPAMDASGAVVGIAAVTQSIYYGNPVDGKREQGPLQMVVKNCIPVATLKAMLQDAE
jgi:serine protease Do